jgi:thiamine-phosphate pyrophosphorylase
MGLTVFRESCRLAAPLPVFALGGVNAANAHQCVAAGAVGVAAIRLFMGKDAGWKVLAQKDSSPKS